ncbi:MAG: tetratricopeptide repeat-containing sensor histidine kinase [Candidatus Kapabacteria bacterium]|jgi:signal transduction histidine kinase|nr:tetratricopeptide repeat-containing sensor histidine kinase [Candidatus Kapabacteria bacterium]
MIIEALMKQPRRYIVLVIACVSVIWCAFVPHALGQTRSIDSLLRELHRPGAEEERFVDLLNELSYAYNAYKADSALLYGQQALKVAEHSANRKGTAAACRNIGFAYQRIGKLADATSFYLRAMPIYEELRDSVGLANVWNGLGICYFEQGDYENALDFYQRGEPLFLRLGKMDRYAASMSNIGYTYLQMGNLNLAQVYADKALSLANKYNVPVIQIFALSHLGDIARRRQEFTEAETFFKRGLVIISANPANAVANSRLYYLLGYLYADMRRFAEAQQYLDSSLALSQQGNMRFRIKDTYEGYQHLYETMNNYKMAYKYQTLTVLYKDSLFNQESARQIAAMQREIQTRAQSTQIQLLTKDNQIQQTTRNGLLGIVGVIIIAGLLLSRAYLRMRTVNKQLSEQNQEILAQRTRLEQQTSEIATMNSELQHKNEHLVELNEEKSQFMRIAAHDLKNPLTSINALAGYIAMEAGKMPSDEVSMLSGRISHTAERMFLLVKNLLDVNAIESGNFALQMINVDAAALLETCVQMYMDAAKAKNITLSFTAHRHLEDTKGFYEFCAFVDEQAFMQVAENLVSNAVKYTPPGKRVFVRIMHEEGVQYGYENSVKKQEFIKIEIQDEGPGLTLNDKQFLFGKFTKLSARPTAGEDSNGLGLSIVKQLVEMMNGQVWCESEYGLGATFIARFPASTFNVA